ncbi:hypothetical protein BJF83_16605 [Nocardiopsis sp. CNR-923]|uniref:alpha/beta hydrolase n=1 Tax=Nocardiopsis sp. CNR-923 TaxID=1904965 RepID=UPI000964795A|nr:hypothetical protein [Nocardiopsis sp. CNR-923]OLT27944.1 hypothetical protein BJF83_16605 [Nocardiopsis sp. CNR-923]
MPDVDPASGEDRRMVVALHGYGGTGADMIRSLSAARAGRHDVVMVAPDGPHHPELAPEGRAWYPITSQESLIARWSRELAPEVARYVEREQERYRIPAERTALVGFSQGVSVATAVLAGFRVARRAVFACGRILGGDLMERTGSGEIDVLVVTGGSDRFVRGEDVRSDTAPGRDGTRFPHVEVPGLGHEFNNEVARLSIEHATR